MNPLQVSERPVACLIERPILDSLAFLRALRFNSLEVPLER